MRKISVAGNEIVELEIPEEIIKGLRDHGMRQFTEYHDHRPVYFRTPLDFANPETGPGYQFEATTSESLDKIKGILQAAIEDIHDKFMTCTDVWYLLQRQESWMYNPPHDHPTSEVLAICYLSIKEGETAIEFYDKSGNFETFYPRQNTVLLSEGTVTHRPVENKSAYDRFSLNFQFNTDVTIQEVKDSLENGGKTTTESERRWNICKSCDKLNSMNFCNECACFMPLKTKIPFAVCPIGKWEVEEANG